MLEEMLSMHIKQVYFLPNQWGVAHCCLSNALSIVLNSFQSGVGFVKTQHGFSSGKMGRREGGRATLSYRYLIKYIVF